MEVFGIDGRKQDSWDNGRPVHPAGSEGKTGFTAGIFCRGLPGPWSS